MLEMSDLVEALDTARFAALRDISMSINHNHDRWMKITPATIAPFAHALMQESLFMELDQKWISIPGSGGIFTLANSAVHLIDRTLEIRPEIIISDLIRFAKERTVIIKEVRAIEGTTVPRSIELEPGISIVPREKLAKGSPGALIFSDTNRPAHGWGTPPHAALVRTYTFKVEVKAPPTGLFPLTGMLPSYGDELRFRVAMAAIMLASNGAPHFRQSYIIVDSPGWLGTASSGWSASEPFPVPVPSSSPVDENRVIAAYEALCRFGSDLDLAIGKLEASRRRLQLDERMIDLGTALEIVLMHNEKSSGEITNKVATRAAWLIGRSGEERLEAFRAARGLYSERSKAVHTGQLKSAKPPTFPGDDSAYVAYDKLCADVIFAVADRGAWPDWNRLVLGAESSG
jgi:hypothetical protein